LNTNAEGELVDGKGRIKMINFLSLGNTIRKFDNMTRIGDIMTISEILQAAGITLEDLSKSPLAKAEETLRDGGVVLMIFIEYAY
jgi:hypothetical protein